MNRTAGCVEIATVKDAEQMERSKQKSARRDALKSVREAKDNKYYQKRFFREKGRWQYPGHELHHLYPKEYQDAFARMGIDCHRPENLMELPKLVTEKSYREISHKRRKGGADDELRGFITEKTYAKKHDGYNLHQELLHKKDTGDWNNQWKQFFIEHRLWKQDKPDVAAIENMYKKTPSRLAKIAADAEDFLQDLIDEIQKGIEDIDLRDFRDGARY